MNLFQGRSQRSTSLNGVGQRVVERSCMGYLEMNEFGFGGPKINMAAARFQDGSFSEDQHTVETKAFKGKGVSALIRDAEEAMQKAVDQMELIRLLMREYSVYGMTLIFHRRKATGQVSLRWRHQIHKNVTFTVVLEAIQKHGSAVVEWYVKVNATVQHYNQVYLRAANERKRLLEFKASLQSKHV